MQAEGHVAVLTLGRRRSLWGAKTSSAIVKQHPAGGADPRSPREAPARRPHSDTAKRDIARRLMETSYPGPPQPIQVALLDRGFFDAIPACE